MAQSLSGELAQTYRQIEALLMLTAVVTREGELRDLALLEPGLRGLTAENPAVVKLLDTVSQTRFQPARSGGAPVAVHTQPPPAGNHSARPVAAR